MKYFLASTFIISVPVLKSSTLAASGLAHSGNPLIHSAEIIENKGQIRDQNGKPRPDVLYYGVAGGIQFFIRRDGISYQLHRPEKQPAQQKTDSKAFSFGPRNSDLPSEEAHAVYRTDIYWLNCNPSFTVVSENMIPGNLNFYNTPEGQPAATHVRTYASITILDLWPGIDIMFYFRNGHLETDWMISRAENVSRVAFRVEGAEVRTDGNTLYLETPFGTISEGALKAYQDERELNARWLVSGRRVGLQVDGAVGQRPIIIDPPVLAWGTYYGYTNTFGTRCIADNTGNIYFSGYTFSNLLIATSGAHQTTFGGGVYDAFLVKFNSAGVREWGTFYGGSLTDQPYGLVLDPAGNVIMAGRTTSPDNIATPGSHQLNLGGVLSDPDGFLVKFTADGIRLWGTYYGGLGDDFVWDCATDAVGNIYIVGRTSSDTGIATFGAHQNVRLGTLDAFIAKFSPDGSRLWGTYFGGEQNEEAYGCAADPSGNLYCVGYTSGSTVNIAAFPHQSYYGGGPMDGFLTKFSPSGVQLWGTYYGGEDTDELHGVAVAPDGSAYVTGSTFSQINIATPGAYISSLINPGAGSDVILAKFSASGLRLWGTYYGGEASEVAHAVSVSADNLIHIFGESYSDTGLVTAGAVQNIYQGGMDAFIGAFDASGNRVWGTYYGGYGGEWMSSGFAYGNGQVLLCGTSESASGIATANGHQPTFYGSSNAYVVRLCESNNILYLDSDGDGFGDTNSAVAACENLPGYVPDPGDCNDGNPSVYPGASEVCNELDDNCNGLTDEGVLQAFYPDNDDDGFGDLSTANMPVLACTPPSGHVNNHSDCNDANPAINPASQEICNSLDDDCDLLTDDDDPSVTGQTTWYADADGDGFGNPTVHMAACVTPTGYVSDYTDCDDNNASIHPMATEICNGLDDNCNGDVDEGCVSVSEPHSAAGIYIYPTLFQDNFTLIASDLTITTEIQLCDLNGKIIETIRLKSGGTHSLLLGQALYPGIYFVRIISQGHENKAIKLVKLR